MVRTRRVINGLAVVATATIDLCEMRRVRGRSCRSLEQGLVFVDRDGEMSSRWLWEMDDGGLQLVDEFGTESPHQHRSYCSGRSSSSRMSCLFSTSRIRSLLGI